MLSHIVATQIKPRLQDTPGRGQRVSRRLCSMRPNPLLTSVCVLHCDNPKKNSSELRESFQQIVKPTRGLRNPRTHLLPQHAFYFITRLYPSPVSPEREPGPQESRSSPQLPATHTPSCTLSWKQSQGSSLPYISPTLPLDFCLINFKTGFFFFF